jgi:antagonist of KipI
VALQVLALHHAAAAAGVALAHVKPHGGLYNLAARDPAIGGALIEGMLRAGACRVLFVLAGSPLAGQARAAGLAVVEEAFADRGYRGDGSLVPRGTGGPRRRSGGGGTTSREHRGSGDRRHGGRRTRGRGSGHHLRAWRFATRPRDGARGGGRAPRGRHRDRATPAGSRRRRRDTMTTVFEVAAPGLLDTVQDLGRWGYQRTGVPVSGAMDDVSLQVGNLLVGNPRGAACLEMALGGPTLCAAADTLIAICGADLGASLDGEPVPGWKSVAVRAGQMLCFRGARAGAFGYLCVAGGIEVPPVLGSRSTCLRGGFGGFAGRALRSGDVLVAGEPSASARAGRSLRPADVPAYGKYADIRVLPGPQADRFEGRALDTFFSARYTVSRRSDRMGCRLEGPALAARGSHDILSAGVAAGSIQVPADGSPIVLLADRQATGGYAVIAAVVSADLAALAPPAGLFSRATVDEAEAAARSARGSHHRGGRSMSDGRRRWHVSAWHGTTRFRLEVGCRKG